MKDYIPTPEDIRAANFVLAAKRRIARYKAKAEQRERAKALVRTEGQRDPRVLDPDYIHWLHFLPCIAGVIEGGCAGPIQAAHQKGLRQQAKALGKRPHDRDSCALCEWHHTRAPNSCDAGGQRKFWERLRVDPTAFCADLYQAFLDGTDGADVVIQYAKDAKR